MIRRPPISPLFPSPTLSRSVLRFPWAAYAFGYEAVEEARRNPAIRHYEGPLMNKPWHLLAEPEVSRSEEHTSELQSRQYLVCRLLLEKKTQLLEQKDTIVYR